MTSRTIAVVTAGLSEPSSSRMLADRLAASAVDSLGRRGIEASVTVIELRELAHDIVNHMLAGFPSPKLADAIQSVTSADGLIAVTPVFSTSYSGLFKSFFDVIDAAALTGMPVAIAATGGTPRHSLALEYALRPLFSYLRAIVIPTAVFAATEDWGSGADTVAPLPDRIARAADELAGLVAASDRSERVEDPFSGEEEFAELLGGFQGD